MSARNVHKEDIRKVQLPADAIQEDRGLSYCARPQLVLATVNDVALYMNDRTAIAYKFDAMTVELEHSSTGELITAPGIEVAFPYQSDAVGFVIDWRQVTDGTGALRQACWRVKISWELEGQTGSFYYGAYQLREYSAFNARKTVRLFVVLNDLVRKQGINYKDSGFAGTIRFEGTFGYMQPNYDSENNVNTERVRQKIRREALRTYELRTNYLLRCMTRLLDEETLLAANQIYITDHNANNHFQDFYDFPVILSEDESPTFEYTDSVFAKVVATFLDRQALHESKYDGNIQGSDNVILQLPTLVATVTPQTILIAVPYESGDTGATITVLTDSDGDIDTVNSTGLTNFSITVNGSPATVPFSLAVSDVVLFSFDAAGSDGVIQLSGTYA